jgi:diketogulonate reductase-like aldo/keto reductase
METTPRTVQLHTGRPIPALGLGTWELTHDTAGTVETALRLGYRMIDTSGDYGTQPGIGEALDRSSVDRSEIYLVTKVEEDEDAYEATGRNLDELRTGYADLMLIHRPPPDEPGRALWEGLIRARDDGLTTDIGVSNYSIDQIEALIDATGEIPVVNQIEWSPFGWSREMLDYCRKRRIVIQAYSPLTRARRLDDRKLGEIAAACRRTAAQVLIRWNLQCGVVAVPKANRANHLRENLGAFDFELTHEQMAALNGLNEEWSSLGRSLLYARA